jgi:cysteine desulfurase / selenocysteine lyase
MRDLFPFFTENPDLIYLDNAATTPVPQTVIDAMQQALINRGSVGRGLYPTSIAATEHVERIRTAVTDLLQKKPKQVAFTHGATHASHLLLSALRHEFSESTHLGVLATDHHSTVGPWSHSVLSAKGTVSLFDPSQVYTHVIISHGSNVTGAVSDLALISNQVRKHNPDALIIIDGSQTIAHLKIDPTEWGIDGFFWSAHKHFGPNGIGALWYSDRLEQRLSLQAIGGGGATIRVDPQTFIAQPSATPHSLEAGSPNYEALCGFEAALQVMQSLPQTDPSLCRDAHTLLGQIPGITLISSPNNLGIITLYHDRIHAHDIAEHLANNHIAVRAGQHCASIIHAQANTPATVRISIAPFTTRAEIEQTVATITGYLQSLASYHER